MVLELFIVSFNYLYFNENLLTGHNFSNNILTMEVRAQGALYLTSDLTISSSGEAEVQIRLPCGVYSVKVVFDTIFGPEGLETEVSVEVKLIFFTFFTF